MTLNIFCSLFKCRKIFNAFEANILFGYFQKKNNKKDFNLPSNVTKMDDFDWNLMTKELTKVKKAKVFFILSLFNFIKVLSVYCVSNVFENIICS